MKIRSLIISLIRWFSAFITGTLVTCILVLTFAVVMFAVGASTGESYEWALRNATVFAIEASGEGLALIVGKGLLLVSVLFGLVNALIKEGVLKLLHKASVLEAASS